jgi:hypothetical protein
MNSAMASVTAGSRTCRTCLAFSTGSVELVDSKRLICSCTHIIMVVMLWHCLCPPCAAAACTHACMLHDGGPHLRHSVAYWRQQIVAVYHDVAPAIRRAKQIGEAVVHGC